MAKLTSLLKFQGSLEELNAYQMEGVDGTVVRRKSSLTREQVLRDPSFSNTRKINKETAGCSAAAGLVLETLGVLRPVVDQSCCGRLNALLKVVQAADAVNSWGAAQRAALAAAGPARGVQSAQGAAPGGRAAQPAPLHGG